MNPNIYIIARVRDLQETECLNALGVDEIIPEEYETSVEIFVRLLEKYLVPREDIEKLVSDVRANGYRMLRKLSDNTIIDSEVNIKMSFKASISKFLKWEIASNFDGKLWQTWILGRNME